MKKKLLCRSWRWLRLSAAVFFVMVTAASGQLAFTFQQNHPPQQQQPERESEYAHHLIRIPGDIVFGGLFPMHEHLVLTDHGGGGGGAAAGLGGGGLEFPCGAIKEEKGFQRLEAMLYALDLINDDPHILPNITIGAVILDTCSSDTHALDQSMEFVRSYMNKVRPSIRLSVGVIFSPAPTTAKRKSCFSLYTKQPPTHVRDGKTGTFKRKKDKNSIPVFHGSADWHFVVLLARARAKGVYLFPIVCFCLRLFP
jgi:hypothetical protein